MSKETWIFRVASSPQDGAGHLSRCQVLANALLPDYKALFVLDKDADGWVEYLAQKNINAVIALPDLNQKVMGCVMDGYHFAEKDYRYWKAKTGFLALISDFKVSSALADLLISPGHAVAPAFPGQICLSGWEYVLLDPAFSFNKREITTDTAQNILVMFGQIDKHNATKKVIEALLLLLKKDMDFHVTVLLNEAAPYSAEIKALLKPLSESFTLILNAEDVKSYLMKSDFVIGAGGVSLLERMAASVPSATIVTASNQEALAVSASQVGATQVLGKIGDLAPKQIAELIMPLLRDELLRTDMSRIATQLVDGKGAHRVSDVMIRQAKKNSIRISV